MKHRKLLITLSTSILLAVCFLVAHNASAQQFPYTANFSQKGLFLEIVCDTPYVINGTAKGHARGMRKGNHSGVMSLSVEAAKIYPPSGISQVSGVFDGENTNWNTDFEVCLTHVSTEHTYSVFDKGPDPIATMISYITNPAVYILLESEGVRASMIVDYYLAEDTVLVGFPLCSQKRMIEDSTNYSKCYPNRRVNLDSAFWAVRHARNLLPFVENYFLDEIAFRLRWVPFPEQTDRPLNKCFPVMPTFDSLAVTFQNDYVYYLDSKCDTTALDRSRTKFVTMMKNQLQTLYSLDHLIANPPNRKIKMSKLMKQRNELLSNQKLERKKFGERFRKKFKSINSR
ncbi:MAG: hypothetical protein OEM52_00605 [bacterium]|nr:hypothetical protein [bacterium]